MLVWSFLKQDSKKNFSGPEKFFFESGFKARYFEGLLVADWKAWVLQHSNVNWAPKNMLFWSFLKQDSKKNFSGPEKFFFESGFLANCMIGCSCVEYAIIRGLIYKFLI